MNEQWIADLHIHSKYSRATSKEGDAPHLDLWARRKGITLVGTGDFTHPKWREELLEALVPAEEGLYRLKDELALPAHVFGASQAPRFVVSGEISTIYKKDGKTRKVHHLILLPGLEEAEKLSHRLEAIGNLHSDGRPILGLDSETLLKMTLDSCPDAVFIPAHIWTPHFSVLGAFSDFDSIEACYGDLSGEIHAVETGLSSDPPMNRRVSSLDRFILCSNSDAHSPNKLGREGNLLSCAMSYRALRAALNTGDGFDGTLEFFPEEGKYHLDGHRACECCLTPEETAVQEGRCPVCGRKLTIGVMNRVARLADRAEDFVLKGAKPFESLMPLPEVLGCAMEAAPAGNKVGRAYLSMLERLGSEFHILRALEIGEAEREGGEIFAEALRRLRAGQVKKRPGYDGEYGVISLFDESELKTLSGQTSLMFEEAITEAVKKPRLREKREADVHEDAVSTDKSAPLFNEEQTLAVKSPARALAVVAGPGSGKTKTLVGRIAYLINEIKVPPREITAVTFTRQAAGELLERLKGELKEPQKLRGLHVGTFHALCLKLYKGRPIISRAEELSLLDGLLQSEGEKMSPQEAANLIGQIKSGLNAEAAPEWLCPLYDEHMKKLNLRDLDDVLLEALDQPLEQRTFTHLLVDEYQDINPLQRKLIAHWSERAESVFVIGDPDQSIYGFRGADAACFERFLTERPDARQITLSVNYRSTPEILSAATALIMKNDGRERSIQAARPSGAAVRLVQASDALAEGIFIAHEIKRMTGGLDMLEAERYEGEQGVTRAFSEIAVLCRTHRQLQNVENCLRHDSIPCVISGRENYLEDGRVKGAIGFLSALFTRDEAGLESALKAFWHTPVSLLERARQALERNDLQSLSAFDALTPFVNAAEAIEPMLKKQKPRKILEKLFSLLKINGRELEKLLNAAVFYEDTAAFLEAMTLGEEADIRRQSGSAAASGAVLLMTLHGAKGLEFPVVFVSGVQRGELPLERKDAECDEEEERRLFFVGLTRAKEELIITSGGEKSKFLDELPRTVRRTLLPGRPQRGEQLSLF